MFDCIFTRFGCRQAQRSNPEPSLLVQVALRGGEGWPSTLGQRFSAAYNLSLEPHSSLLGDFMIATELWPSPKLRPGTAALSDALYWALGAPPAGTGIEVHELRAEGVDAPSNEVDVQLHFAGASGGPLAVQPRAAASPVASPELMRGGASPAAQIASPAMRGQRGRTPVQAMSPSMRGSASKAYTTPEKSDVSRPVAAQAKPSPEMDSQRAKALSEALLSRTGEVDGKALSTLQFLAFQAFKDRPILAGNLVRLPFLGLDIVLRVSEIVGAGEGTPVQVLSSHALSILGWDDGRPFPHQQSRPGLAYAHKAAQAAAQAVDGGDGGPAAVAAFQAAGAGERSLGTSYADLGGLQAQVSFDCAYSNLPACKVSLHQQYTHWPPSLCRWMYSPDR